MRISAILLFWLLCTRPAAALLCGTILSPMTVVTSNLSFGVYAAGSPLTANTSITIRCGLPLDLLPSFQVRLSSGNAASPGARFLKRGSDRLFYNIYTDPGFASIWGDGGSGSVERFYDGLLSLGAITFTGFGRLPAGQYVPGGTYSDQLIVTVIF